MSDSPEIAALQQRLLELDDEKQQLLSRLATLRMAEQPDAQPRGTPVGTGTPITNDEKIALFLAFFGARTDVFPKRWESTRTGKQGYSPACRNEWVPGVCRKPAAHCADCPERSFLPLDASAVDAHLRGTGTIGTYAIRADDTCIFIAADFDGAGWPFDAAAYRDAGRKLGIDVALERSRSGNGAHAWVFFAEPVPATQARRLATLLLNRAHEERPDIGFTSYDRLFPNQDYLPRGGFGNLIALPLQGVPRRLGNSVFLDDTMGPELDQWARLSRLRRLSSADLEEILGQHAPAPEVESDSALLDSGTSRDTAEPLLEGRTVVIRLGAQLAIPLDGLHPRLVSRLKRLAAFPNPEFYKLSRMRFPTRGHPRIIFSGELQDVRLILPRGVLDAATEVLRAAGAAVEVRDERPPAPGLSCRFHGQLTQEQKAAVKALAVHDFGVFVAPPGTGKTVVGCALVARRKTSTLVLVHRQPLVDQWRDRLSEFLGLQPDAIGLLAGTSRNLTGRIGIAMLQTLNRAIDLKELLPAYGQLIVDECHHIPASSFELVLRQIPVRYLLGLTATPYRKDGLQRIIHFQCGPIRHEVRAGDGGILNKRVIVRPTGFRLPPELGPQPPIHVVWQHLVNDAARNELVASDVVDAIKQGRTPLVISDRKEHLQLLADRIRPRSPVSLTRLDGSLPRKERTRLIDSLHAEVEAGRQVCLLATASLIGEGFDLPALDTLFLAMPISFRGRIVQYAGRLHRQHAGKSEVIVYDYLDDQCALTLTMYRRRLPAYRRMEYAVETTKTSPLDGRN